VRAERLGLTADRGTSKKAIESGITMFEGCSWTFRLWAYQKRVQKVRPAGSLTLLVTGGVNITEAHFYRIIDRCKALWIAVA
jgi:hypothetical protein